MKKIAILSMVAILNLSCNAQENKKEANLQKDSIAQVEPPKGTWKVDKEFDENGNLIRYDSIYSWSSTDNLDELAQRNPDSLLQSFRSKFYRNFSHIDNQRFGDLFSDDSPFTKRFFDDDFFDSDFGEDFMDIDRIQKRMETMQQRFLERYQSEFEKLENESSQDKS
ncbi:hypothetical protein SAMN03080594_101675 [Arenibacter palladensis]|uniref:Uncharacterized protein n=1 Tax=Arenibacter palladensis TaxID=237373 RepID=A0A1M4UM26_9FLAO|nr:hypothetical protein [Arenibacter palladensis]SHE57715.1 hypothetical protein SAMN03080594_101675 [Arenibacter palladensis]